MKDVPVYIGIQRFEGASVILRIVAKVEESNVFTAQRILNREVKLLFDANGIKNPFPKSAPVPVPVLAVK